MRLFSLAERIYVFHRDTRKAISFRFLEVNNDITKKLLHRQRGEQDVCWSHFARDQRDDGAAVENDFGH